MLSCFYWLPKLQLPAGVFQWFCARRSSDSDAFHLPDLYEASLKELQQGLEDETFTSVNLVKAYLARINEVNIKGPGLRAIIEVNPFAVRQAAALDSERRKFGSRGHLHGIPIILKDNIATEYETYGLNTTAGSYALKGSIVPRNAFVVDQLEAAGAIILAKSNMSEWADFRGNIFGWSARGGLSTSPFFPGGDSEGSSSGSAVSVAIGLAAAALGTETDGSIITPACRQNIVGIKPTLGLTSRAGIIPASEHQDSAGILARSVADAAIMLSVIAGKDIRDRYTLNQPNYVPDYFSGLDATAIRGARLGVPRHLFENDFYSRVAPEINASFDDALKVLESLGAIIVDHVEFPGIQDILRRETELKVLLTDLKDGLERYLSELVEIPSGARKLRDLIEFNVKHRHLELPDGYDSQDRFLTADSLPGFDDDYHKALKHNIWLGTEGSIDFALRAYNLDAIVVPSRGKTSTPAALAGYPMISVPLGFLPDDKETVLDGYAYFPAPGLPFGLAFTSSAFTEAKLLNYAFAFEQQTQVRLKRRAFHAAIPKTQLCDIM